MRVILFILIAFSLSSASLSRDGKIVSDSATGLQWQDDAIVASTQRNWTDAIAYCENTLALGGHDDWRLPNKKELLSIADRSRYHPALDTSVFQNFSSSNYWSSTTNARDTNYAWIVDFYYGDSYNYGKTRDDYVRCVRGGQFDDSDIFRYSYDLNKIAHTDGSNVANTFSIHLKNFKSLKDDEGNDLENISDVCDDYVFKVVDSKGHGATQDDCTVWSEYSRIVIDFKLNTIGTRQAYFEDGDVEVCRKSDPAKCTTLEKIDDFTVYGTLFDLKKDAFSFENASWEKADYATHLDAFKNKIAFAGDAVAELVKDDKKSDFWNSVGYYETVWFSPP